MKVWITKYWLTRGVFETEGKVSKSDPSGRHFSGVSIFENYHGEGKEWHRTKKSADERVKALAEKKLTALQKQVSKVEKILKDLG